MRKRLYGILILLMTVFNEEAENEGRITSVGSPLTGFGYVGTYEEFLQEIQNRGLILPTEE